MNKIKVGLMERLCAVGIIKKYHYPHFSTEFVLNTTDLDAVFELASQKKRVGLGVGIKVDADYDNKSYFRAYLPGGVTLTGEELVKKEVVYEFDETDDGYVSVKIVFQDGVQNNARYTVSSLLKIFSKFGFRDE